MGMLSAAVTEVYPPIRENPQLAGYLAIQSIERFASLQDIPDRQQIFDHGRRADTGQRPLFVTSGV